MEAAATDSLVSSPAGVMFALAGIAAFFFWLERATGWKVFRYLVPMLWIYATPMVLRNTGVLPAASPAYDVLRSFGLPMFIVLLLVGVDVGATVRVMGRGVLVMLLGTVGVVLGAPIAYFVVHRWLDPEAWRAFGALAGSWIGGTGNMAAVAGALETPPDQFGLAVLADTVIYTIWLPILLLSKGFAERFNRFSRVASDRLERMDAAAAAVEDGQDDAKRPATTVDYLYLLTMAFGVTFLANTVAPRLPELGDVVSTSTWNILLVTTSGLLLSLTPARRIPGSHALAMAIVYMFVARMGATASLEGMAQAPAFLLGALIWIAVHGAFCVFGAWLFRVDLHSAAIASAANIGGAASAPVVAAYHRESLVPASILMALLGYGLGNYLALVAAQLCAWVGG
jgi:uncharacterized membrane protein